MKKHGAVVKARKEFLRKHRLSKRQFAETTGNDVGTVRVWFKTGRTPRRKYLEDIQAQYPDWPIRQVEA